MASQIKVNSTEKRCKRMRFGVIEGEEYYKRFLADFERQFDCTFEQVKLVDELFKKRDDSVSIYNNGIRVTSYSDQNQPYEIEQILNKEFDCFFEYNYNLIKSLDDPTPLLLGLDYESTSRIEVKNGLRVFLPHFGLNVLVYEFRNANIQMVETGLNGYVAEFNFFFESNLQQQGDGSRDKVIELEKIIFASFKNSITRFADISINVKDEKGYDDVKRLRPLLK